MKTLIMSLGLLLCMSTSAMTECDFQCTLKQHLDAIQARDFVAFEATLTRDEKLTFILPNGKYFDDSAEYREMLKGWFAETGWTFNYQIISTDETAEMALALLSVEYREADRGGEPYALDHYLHLVFKKEQGDWRLVYDQNTKVFDGE